MRIDPKTVTPITSYKTREQAPATQGKAPSSTQAAVVTLSSAGAAASSAAADVPPSVIPRVHQIRALIARGEYPIDLDKLASSIVDDETPHSTGKRGGTA